MTLNVGVVGAGTHGARYLRHLAGDVPDLAPVALCRRNESTGQRLATEHGLRWFADGDALINDPEVQAVNGDSGGAVFVWNGAVSELVGILFARGSRNSAQATQPSDLALFENISVIVDLDHYRSQILGVIDQPDCADGLDEDGDGLVDFPDDPGCDDAFDASEWSAALICDNGLDDDGDLLIDYPEDDGCDDLLDASEVPEPELPVALAAGVMALLTGAQAGARQKSRPVVNCQL